MFFFGASNRSPITMKVIINDKLKDKCFFFKKIVSEKPKKTHFHGNALNHVKPCHIRSKGDVSNSIRFLKFFKQTYIMAKTCEMSVVVLKWVNLTLFRKSMNASAKDGSKMKFCTFFKPIRV